MAEMARRAVIEREELFAVANSMAAEGKPVTALNLKDALGGGSLTTIYKYLADWESVRETVPTSANGTDLPDAVQNAFLSTWRVAANEAAKQIAAAKEKAAEEVRAAQKKFEEALYAIQKLEADSEQDGAQIEILKSRIAELEQSVSQLSNDNAAARATAEQLQHQVKSQQAEIDRFHKDMERENHVHREQMERRDAAINEASELRGQIAALKEQNAQLITAMAQLGQTPEKARDKK